MGSPLASRHDGAAGGPLIEVETGSEPWHATSLPEVFVRLSAVPEGLTEEQAALRLQILGQNELREAQPVRPVAIFAAQFKSLLVLVLIGAGILSGFLGDVVDALAILAIVLLNAGIGFYQEFSAERSIAALRRLTAPRARVRRGGRARQVPAAELVAGDIVELEPGDLVPADARLVQAHSLKCVESVLTGEPEAVDKRTCGSLPGHTALAERVNMVFMGTSVAAGQARAVVVATAMQTEIGRIAGLIESASSGEATPLQRKLESFGRALVWVSLGIVALLFALGLARGLPFLNLFMTSVSLAVAAVPEGLPSAVTVALALGVARAARRRALVRRLAAVETLGCTTVICVDKTGTLTVGEMTVRELYVAGRTYAVSGEGYGPGGEVLFEGRAAGASHAAPLLELATVLVGCNNAHLVLEGRTWKVIGDPTEGALLAGGGKAGGSRERIEKELPLHHEIPFDSDRKRRTVLRLLADGRLRAFVNGAPEIVLDRCTRIYTAEGVHPMTEADRRAIAARNAVMGHRGLRVLGSACRDFDQGAVHSLGAEEVERELTFVGLAGVSDPPRPEVKKAIATCREAGIRVVMITGDQPRTALTIARELGIAPDADVALAGSELDRMSDEALRERAPRVAVYARATAAHKLRIVRAWKANGAVVAMTGDGVNDAPAVKAANIGIAMGRSGSEVTKQASDMILTDDNFASIVAAVEEGRGIYDNIRKTVQYLLAGNLGELLLMGICILIGLPAPLLPIQLLWINLVTDGLPALALAADPIEADVMKRPPRRAEEPISDRGLWWTMLLTGFLSCAVSAGVYLHGLAWHDPSFARTSAFTTLVFAELLRSLGSRSDRKTVWRIGPFGNWKLVLVVAISLTLQFVILRWAAAGLFFKTAPVSWPDALRLLAISTVPLSVMEGVKAFRARREREASGEG